MMTQLAIKVRSTSCLLVYKSACYTGLTMMRKVMHQSALKLWLKDNILVRFPTLSALGVTHLPNIRAKKS